MRECRPDYGRVELGSPKKQLQLKLNPQSPDFKSGTLITRPRSLRVFNRFFTLLVWQMSKQRNLDIIGLRYQQCVFCCFLSGEDDIIVQFAIWERGDIGLDQLKGQLKLALRHALCDLLTEYYLLAAPLSKVPKMYRKSAITRQRSCSDPPFPTAPAPKGPKLGSLPETSERSTKRQLDFGSQSGFRNRSASSTGQRRTPSIGSHHSTPSSGSTGVSGRTHQNPFLSQRQSVSSFRPVSRQSTEDDEVFQTEAASLSEEAMGISGDRSTADAQEIAESSSVLPQAGVFYNFHCSYCSVCFVNFFWQYKSVSHSKLQNEKKPPPVC